MRFRIDRDSGDVIKGWVAPDNPLAIGRVAVTIDGQRMAEIAATGINLGVRQHGWHSTGECDFTADETQIPGLEEIKDLEIHDVDTNLLVHRRSSAPSLCQGKLILINASIHPETAFQNAVFPHFLFNYSGIGKFSEQIMASLLDNKPLTSLFMSGNFIFLRYEAHITVGDLTTALLIHDPYVEMASRLIWLRDRGNLSRDAAQRWRLGAYAEAAAFAKDYDYTDTKQLKHFLRMLPQTAYHLLYNPLTRQFGTYNNDDQMIPGHSVLAVEALARVGVVGHRNYYEAFAATVFDRLGIHAPLPAPALIPPETLALAAHLKTIKAAREFVVFDVAISDGVQRSVARNWSE